MKNPKSKEGAERQLRALIRAYRKEFAEGGAFGFDWPTFRLNDPARYARACELKTLYPTLPNRKK